MKKVSFLASLVLTAVLVLSTALCSAQDSIQYQLVIRNAAGQLITNKQVNMKFSLVGGEQSFYEETQPATTDKYGNISVFIGTGTAVKGAMKDVPWSTMDISLKVEADTDGGENFKELGTVPIAAAPYALYAATAGSNATNGNPKDGEALFEVCNRDGQPVFAVYNSGIVVYVDESNPKAKRSGLVVTGRTARKDGEPADYFAVDAEGTHIYVDDTDETAKPKRSGLVVTGRTASKSATTDEKHIADDRTATKADGVDMFTVNGSLTTVYVDDSDNGDKAKRSGLIVTGRSASKGNDIIDINAKHTNLVTTEMNIAGKVEEPAETQQGEEPEPVQPKSLFSISSGQVQVSAEISMIGDVEKKVEAEIIELATDTLKVGNDIANFRCNYIENTSQYALMAIYGEGSYVPVYHNNGDQSFILFDEAGFITKQHSMAAVLVVLLRNQICIRPLRPLNRTIEFGVMDQANATSAPYSFVKLTAEIRATTGQPFVLAETEHGSVTVKGDLFYGESVTLTAVPDDGYFFKNWDNGLNNIINPKTVTIGFDYQPIKAHFAEPVLFVKSEDEGGNNEHTGFDEDYALASLSGAITHIINSNTNKKLDWTINVVGEVSGAQTIDYDGEKANTIKIAGYGENATLKGAWEVGGEPESETDKYTVLSIKTKVPITIENLAITGGYSDKGGGINIAAGGNVTLGNDAVVTQNYGDDGGGISLIGYATEYGVITYTTLNITAGSKVTNNETKYNGYGGGIYAQEYTKLFMTGGQIDGNTANHGGGVYIAGGTLVMSGGTISSNVANNGTGGGVYLGTYDTGDRGYLGKPRGINAKLYMNGSAVIGNANAEAAANADSHSNKANMGGGIYIYSDVYGGGELYLGYDLINNEPTKKTLTGGIYHNYAESCGGGVYAAHGFMDNANFSTNCAAEISSGNIAYNTAETDGGGIYLQVQSGFDYYDASPVLTMSGGTVYGNAAKKVTADDEIIGNGAGMYVGSFHSSNGLATPKVKMSGSATFATDNDVYLSSEATITVDGTLTGTVPVATLTPAQYQGGTQLISKGETLSVEEFEREVVKFALTGMPSFILTEGKIPQPFTGTTINDLKNAILNAEDGAVIYLAQTIVNSNNVEINVPEGKTVTIKRYPGHKGLLINATKELSFNTAENSGRLILDGGSLDGLTAEDALFFDNAGCGYLYNITFQNNNNTAGNGGALRQNNTANTRFYNCIFENCHAKNGGALYMNSYITLSNATITNCSASNMGGAIYAGNNMCNSRPFSIENGISVSGCEATNSGNNFYFAKTGSSWHYYFYYEGITIQEVLDGDCDAIVAETVAKYTPDLFVKNWNTVPTAAEYPKLYVASEADLIKLAGWVNNAENNAEKVMEGITFTLVNNIALTNAFTAPIGTGFGSDVDEGKSFWATFDGNGHTISNLNTSNYTTETEYPALFGNVTGTVKNLTVSGASSLGGIVGCLCSSSALIENCTSNVEITASETGAAGIATHVRHGTIRQCTNNGKITSSSSYVGGIVGQDCFQDNCIIIDGCVNNGEIEGTFYVGGIVGSLYNSEVRNCVNTGSVKSTVYNGCVGGIAGNYHQTYLGDDYDIYGINNCYNKGAVNGAQEVGGIVGDAKFEFNGYIRNCYNAGSVTLSYSGAGPAGGVLGQFSKSDGDIEIESTFYLNGTATTGIGGTVPSGVTAPAAFEATQASLSDLRDALNTWLGTENNNSGNNYKSWIIKEGGDGYPEFAE